MSTIPDPIPDRADETSWSDEPVDLSDERDADIAIELDDVFVRYPLDSINRLTLKSEVFRILTARPSRQAEAANMAGSHYFEALRGINLTIRDGERVGLIGHNGAGKSTLLRTVGGIYRPHRGRMTVRGRVHTLFDLATGFEGHATGRENILFRGLVMGLPRREIQERMDEIIEFAGLGDFIDMPVQTYSSGMGVRLAFAVSTHLEGDILLIDEVFGAGDAAFQKKAEARMTQLISDAKTLMFASHSNGLVERFCDRCIWLDHGQIRGDGPSKEMLEAYMASVG